MTARYMLDTNIIVYLRRRQPETIARKIASLAPGAAVMSVVTFGELRTWVEKSSSRDKAHRVLDEICDVIRPHPMAAEVGHEYGVIRAELETSGQVIGNNDLWIAAHARADGLTLVTNNEREFRRVPGLKVENWTAEAQS